jgi:parallel beta-helix repeat protein
MNINAENITLDCQNYSINQKVSLGQEKIGIYSDKNNIIIKNCNINIRNDTGWKKGPVAILLENSQNSKIINNRIKKTHTQISLISVENTEIKSNYLENGGAGIQLTSSSNNIIKNNKVRHNYFAIFLTENSNNNLVKENDLDNNGIGIELNKNSDNNNLYNNSASSSTYGIQIFDCSGNNLTLNKANNNVYNGIFISRSSSHNLFNNLVCDNSQISLSDYDNDIYIYNSEVYGQENTCNRHGGLNDKGTKGCKYPCSSIPFIKSIAYNEFENKTNRSVGDIEPSGIGIKNIKIYFSEDINFKEQDIIIYKVNFSEGQENIEGRIYPRLIAYSSYTKNMLIEFETASIVDTWVKVILKDNISDKQGNKLDGEGAAPWPLLDRKGYIYDNRYLPTGDRNEGGDAIFYLGSLRADFNENQQIDSEDQTLFNISYQNNNLDADFWTQGENNSLPDGKITPIDINGFLYYYQQSISLLDLPLKLSTTSTINTKTVESPPPIALEPSVSNNENNENNKDENDEDSDDDPDDEDEDNYKNRLTHSKKTTTQKQEKYNDKKIIKLNDDENNKAIKLNKKNNSDKNIVYLITKFIQRLFRF